MAGTPDRVRSTARRSTPSSKALAFGLVLPALWWLYPAFLRTIAARTLVVVLLVWKIATWMLVPQAGWCGQFLVGNPPQIGGWSLTRSWDARTYWNPTPPACSAIVARGYARPTQFPAWSINLPYGHDRDLSTGGFVSLPEENAAAAQRRVRAAGPAVRCTRQRPGRFACSSGPTWPLSGDVDARPIRGRQRAGHGARPGSGPSPGEPAART